MTTPSWLKVSALAVALAPLAGFATIPSQAGADDVITWRVQTRVPEGSCSYEDDIGVLAERLETRTDGRLRLEVHGAGSRFGADEIFSAVRKGTIAMGTLTPGYIIDRSELAGIAVGLPSRFHTVWEAAHFHFHEGFEAALREDFLERHGVYYASGIFHPTELVAKEPIESLDAFKGMVIRSSGTRQTFLTDAGASASMIPGEGFYQAWRLA